MPSKGAKRTNPLANEPREYGQRRGAIKGQRRGQPQPKVPGDPNARWRPPANQSDKEDKKAD